MNSPAVRKDVAVKQDTLLKTKNSVLYLEPCTDQTACPGDKAHRLQSGLVLKYRFLGVIVAVGLGSQQSTLDQLQCHNKCILEIG